MLLAEMEMWKCTSGNSDDAADRVLSPKKGSEELIEDRDHCSLLGKAQADVFNPADICTGELCSWPGRLQRKLREERRTQ